jgi:apolipoprotein N-acyltransferase
VTENLLQETVSQSRPDIFKYAWAFLAGSVCVFGFAPFGIFPIPVFALAVLFVLWSGTNSSRKASWLGFAFGFGLFCAGVAWIYIALHDFGGMPAILSVAAMTSFAGFLALFPALAGYLQTRFNLTRLWRVVLVMPATWVMLEWLRGTIFSGFPWLTLGYAHSDSLLAGYASLLGVYGVSLVAAVCAGLLAILWNERWNKQGRIALFIFLIFWAAGALLHRVSWTRPQGAPFSVTLVQGNIGQDVKFNPDVLENTLDTYRRLVMQNPARLTVLPETALPMMIDEVPQDLVDQLRDHARRNQGDVLIGVFEHERAGYYNSVVALGASEDALAAQRPHYRKHHLVIFGEFIPFRPVLGWLINEVLHIPMGDLARGEMQQSPLRVAGQLVAVNICYEDVFGEEIISALPLATLLVNLTNDAWYGHSYAAAQHNQMSQFRAMESGRMMLRATNTGVTSIIAVNGKVLQQLPQHIQGILQGDVQGYAGATPYVNWGNSAVLLLIALMLSGAWIKRVRFK